jgi:hypothetical protein
MENLIPKHLLSPGADEFRRSILSLIEEYGGDFARPASANKIFKTLGCTYTVYRGGGYEQVTSEQPAGEHEVVVTEALFLLAAHYDRSDLETIVTGLSILSGLYRNERWTACTTSPEKARSFAALVTHVLSKHDYCLNNASSGILEFYVEMFDEAQRVLNKWLRPGGPSEVFSPSMLARDMFGDAWCSIVLDASKGGTDIADFIVSTKPEFRPGLIRGQGEPEMETLPVLTGFEGYGGARGQHVI